MKNVESLPSLINKAQDLGIRFVACKMSMNIMGMTRAELLDEVRYAGAAAYLEDVSRSSLTLSIQAQRFALHLGRVSGVAGTGVF